MGMRLVKGSEWKTRGECLDEPEMIRERIGVLRRCKPDRTALRLASLRMTGWIFICLGLMVACAVKSEAQGFGTGKTLSPLEQSLAASEKGLIEAKKKDDRALLRRTVTDDFSLVGVDGTLLQKQEAVDDLGDSGLIEIMTYNMKVVPVGDDAAIVTYDAVVRKKPEEDQGPPPRYQHLSSVWVKQGDGWKLKFHQATAAHWGDW